MNIGATQQKGQPGKTNPRQVILGSDVACRRSHGPVGVLTGKGAHALGERSLRGEAATGRSQA